MPRGRRKVEVKTLEEQILALDAEIESYQQKIQEAKAKRKELTSKKKQKEIDALYAEIQTSGKTVEDVIAMIKQN